MTSEKGAPIGPDTIKRFTLSNGFKVLFQENHTTPSVVVRGHLRAGAIQEEPGKCGLADFTADVLRRGTTTRNFGEINGAVEEIGAEIFFDGGRHTTSFGMKSLAEDMEYVLGILADVLRNPTFPPAEVEKARGQRITFLKEMENDTERLAHRHFRKLLYGPDHPYGTPTEGTLETVPGITAADLAGFYRAHYHPAGGVIVVVGDVVPQKAIDAVEKALGDWNPPADPSIPGPSEVKRLSEGRRFVRPMENKTQTDIALGTVGPNRAAPDYYAAALGNLILGRLGLMGRLGDNVRDKQGLAYYSYSALEAGLGQGPWAVYAGVNPRGVDRAIESILFEIRRIIEEPVTTEELQDAKAFQTGSMPLRLESNGGIASMLLQMELYGLGDDFIARYDEIINPVTAEEIQSAARRYLDPEHCAIAIVGPEQQ